jgi:glycosyltransferase involved in cell wall biosynthesis
MKRVLIFDLQYYPFVGGAEVAIKEITDRIPREEIEFHLLTARFDSTLPRREQVGNVLVHRIGLATRHPDIADLKRYPLHLNKYLYQVLAPVTALALHRRYRYDLIWAMMAHSAGIPAGIFKRFHPEVKYLLTLQEGDPPAHIERLMRPVWPLFRQAFTLADALQPISNFLARWGARMGFRGQPDIIPNAVDTARFAAAPPHEALLRLKEELGKKEGDVYLVTTSRLVHKNAVDDVIRALPLLPEHISFLIYGVGPDEANLTALAHELGVHTRARFMGHIDSAQIPLALLASDIFIRPSRSEGMGNSFVEAMAAGLPVIATQEGGIADFLFDETRNPDHPATGWAVDPDAPRQIAAAVEDILHHPEKARRVREAALTLVRAKYDWELVARDMHALFDRLGKES